jgi:carotenoid cleavage dioxygenase
MTQRRDFLAGLAAASLTAHTELWAAGLTPGTAFAADAPELRPFRGLDGQDLAAQGLTIEGRWPRELRGRYFRNGPAITQRAGQRYHHWFDGDGLVQAWHIEDGQVRHQARFVQTQKFRAEQAAGRFLLPAFGTAIHSERPVRNADSMNAANTSVMLQADSLYALWEGGSAYELDPATLATRGPKVWSEALRGMPFSAHPKVEPDGTVWNFGLGAGRLALYQLSAQGQVLRSAVLAEPMPAMLHDFVVSQRYIVFLLAPVSMDAAALRAGDSMVDAMRWHAEQPTRVLVINKADFSQRRLLEMPAAHVFHFGNAWDDGDLLRLDYVQGPALPAFNAGAQALMRGERPVRDAATPRVLEIDLASGRLQLHERSEAVEFPVVDPRVVAKRHRQVWYPTAVDTQGRWGFNGLTALDIDTGRHERFSFGQQVVLEEHVMVPRPGSQMEGEGWLLGMGYDIRRERSFLSVFDAQAVSAGPLARAWLPYWVPYGFHGKFYAT